MKYSQIESYRNRIHDIVDNLEEPYWIKYIFQLVYMIYNTAEEIYPEFVEEDDYYGET